MPVPAVKISAFFQFSACLLLILPAGFFLAGCATKTYAPEVAPIYVVIRDATPFYRLGPQQAKGPDASLRTDAHVKLLRREMGFSLVQLEDLRTGYVANENMAVAPSGSTLQAPATNPEETPKKRKSHQQPPVNEEASDSSLPGENESAQPTATPSTPDLQAEPGVVPENIPAPDATPAAAPKFRY